MKLLILTPYIPYPINSGGNLGFFGLVDRMRKYVDVSIIFIATDSQDNDIKELQKLWSNITFYIYKRDTISEEKLPFRYSLMAKLAKSFVRKLKRKRDSLELDLVRKKSVASYGSNTFYEPLEVNYINFVFSVIENNSFDLVQVDFFDLIDIVHIIPHNVKKIFIHHELRYVRGECEQKLFSDLKISDKYIQNYLKSYELVHLLQYDGIASMTEIDKQKLEKGGIPASKIFVSPAIVDIKTVDLADNYKFGGRIVYLGGSDHFPNYDAVDWFLKNCWENIHTNNPSLEFHVIGAWKSRIAKGYESRYTGVRFRGFVDDLSAELANAIMIVPLRIGSGVRMKILEAISLGCPVISTPVGAEGIGLVDRKDVLYGDTSSQLIAAVAELTSDNNLCVSIRKNAYSKLLERPNPDELAKVRLEIYKEILRK